MIATPAVDPTGMYAGPAGPAVPGPRAPTSPAAATHDPAWIRRLVIGVTVGFVGLFVLVPLAAVFGEAFRNGVAATAGAPITRAPRAGAPTRRAR